MVRVVGYVGGRLRVLGYMGGSVATSAEQEFLVGFCVMVGDCMAGGAEGEFLAIGRLFLEAG